MKKEIEEQIKRNYELIEMMREDEKDFGLVNEDKDKINQWNKEIILLKQKLK